MHNAPTSSSDAIDHRELVAYVAISKSHGTDRRLHRVQGDPSAGDLENGAACEVACQTTLTSTASTWRAKPAGVFPPGYHPLCTDPECFGTTNDDVDGLPEVDGQ